VRKLVATVVAIVVAASCIPWLQHQRFVSVFVAIIAIVLAGLIVLGVVKAQPEWSKKGSEQGGTAQSGWWSSRKRNLSLGTAVILVLMITVPHFVATSSGPYKLAMATANQMPQFTEVLGAPISGAWFSEGRTEYGSPAKAELRIPVTGSKQNGYLQVLAIMEAGRWKLKELTLEPARSGERIDLLAGPR
jgi:Cytochrome oxidase complex assembly protein 1